MKKSLLITLEFPPIQGGISNYYFNLYSHLPPELTVILANTDRPSGLSTAYKVYYKKFITASRFIWPKWIGLFFIAKKIIKTEHIECLHVGHVLPTGIVALVFKKLFGLPYIVFSHGKDIIYPQFYPRKKRMLLSVLRHANHIITNSAFTKNQITALGIDDAHITVCHPCPNITDEPIDSIEQQKLLSRWHLNDKKIILTVSRLMPGKGHDMVLAALPAILQTIPDAQYAIIGDGPEKQRLQDLTKKLNVSQAVLFMGDKNMFRSQADKEILLTLYKNCCVFVMPARTENKTMANQTKKEFESFGMVFLEANLFGKPVIGGRSGGQPEAIQDNISGLLVDPTNQIEITQTLIRLLTDKQLAAQLGRQGQARVLSEFQWSAQAQRIMPILNAI